jgi:putative transposase
LEGAGHTAEQIIRELRTAEQLIAQGRSGAEVRRNLAVTQPAKHHWRQSCGEEAEQIHQLWAMDVRFEATTDGRERNSGTGS